MTGRRVDRDVNAEVEFRVIAIWYDGTVTAKKITGEVKARRHFRAAEKLDDVRYVCLFLLPSKYHPGQIVESAARRVS